MREIKYTTAIAEALEQEMTADPDVLILGRDVENAVCIEISN